MSAPKQQVGDGQEIARLQQWNQRWEKNALGWHKAEYHNFLTTYYDQWMKDCATLNDEPKYRTLVPLCGKTLDMLFLKEKGHDTIGGEAVRKAIEEFATENKLTLTQRDPSTLSETCAKTFVVHQISQSEHSLPIQIFQGDFFLLRDAASKDLGMFSSIYDRASLTALDLVDRVKYADILHSVLVPQGKILLIVPEYPQDHMQGPPWSVPEEHVRALFDAKRFLVEYLDSVPSPRPNLKEMVEKVYMITKR